MSTVFTSSQQVTDTVEAQADSEGSHVIKSCSEQTDITDTNNLKTAQKQNGAVFFRTARQNNGQSASQSAHVEKIEHITPDSTKIFTNLAKFLTFLEIPAHEQTKLLGQGSNFAFKVPYAYANKIAKNSLDDPLLLQVLPSNQELVEKTGFVKDPLEEQDSNKIQGLIHKYTTRVLLTIIGGCAINCRYCFRQHYDYSGNKVTKQQWQNIYDYIGEHTEVNEVILSGGDPLTLNNKMLFKVLDNLESIPQVQTIRIHSRQAISMPARLDNELITRLDNSRCNIVLVTHCNHPNEIGDFEQQVFKKISQTSITVLNQSVYLRGINDDAQILAQLSYKLFNAGIIPYYLHLLDKVAGATHFYTHTDEALQVYKELLAIVSGYLVPKLARELPNEPNKTPICP